jgi:hypothetical protein
MKGKDKQNVPIPEVDPENDEKKELFYHENGKTYFTRKTERLIFFALTLVMILVAVLAKLGILG